MEPRLVDQSAFDVVGLEVVTTPKSPEIPALWDSFVPRMHEISTFAPEKAAYGVMTRDEGDPGSMRYLAGLAVVGASSVPRGMKLVTIPAGRYAVFSSSLAGLSHDFDSIYGIWLPASGLRVDGRPVYERYGEEFDPGNPHSLVTIHIPVGP